ncbi:MAG: hypothetical protein KC535_01960 [Nanoarchaeota archaeon]|nr:hypothetical protein [Nanoarchaeota archaeon]
MKILVVLIALFAIVGTTQKLFAAGDKVLEGKDCQATLGLQDFTDKTFVIDFENNCRTITTDIPETKIRTKNNDDLSREISRKIVRTWDIVHQGTIDDLWNKADWLNFLGGQSCFIVYSLNVNYVPEDPFTYAQLYQYMRENNYKVIEGVEKSYLSYIQTEGGHGAVIFPEAWDTPEKFKTGDGLENNAIKEGTSYAISVVSPYEGWDSFFSEKKNTVILFSTTDYARNTMRCEWK